MYVVFIYEHVIRREPQRERERESERERQRERERERASEGGREGGGNTALPSSLISLFASISTPGHEACSSSMQGGGGRTMSPRSPTAYSLPC